MKKISGLAMIMVVSLLLLSGCAPSEDKQAKEILAEYFQQREAKLYIDDYEKTGVVEAKAIENNEILIVNDGANKNTLYVFEPTNEKKTNPGFLVDVANKEVFQKILNTRQAGVPVYVKVSPLLNEEVVDSAFTKIETETTPELKDELTEQLETAKTELYGNSTATDENSGTTASSATASGSGTSSGTGSASGTTTQPGSGSSITTPPTTDDEIPTATVEFYQSLIPGSKVVLVKMNTDKPEDYKVTYADETLTYSADFGAYYGDVPMSVAENLEPVTTRR